MSEKAPSGLPDGVRVRLRLDTRLAKASGLQFMTRYLHVEDGQKARLSFVTAMTLPGQQATKISFEPGLLASRALLHSLIFLQDPRPFVPAFIHVVSSSSAANNA